MRSEREFHSMGSSSSPHLMTLLLLLISVSVFIPQAIGCYSSIFSFGDSITDTGNLYISSHNSSFHFFFPPYGETYFHHPTGRCSDGRLIIDFIGKLPSLLNLYAALTKLTVVSSLHFLQPSFWDFHMFDHILKSRTIRVLRTLMGE